MYDEIEDEFNAHFRAFAESVARAKDPAWFLDPVWQAGEREADADIAAGRGRFFESEEDFLESL